VDGKSVEIDASWDPQCPGSNSITRISATQFKMVVRRKEPVYLVHLSQIGVDGNPAEKVNCRMHGNAVESGCVTLQSLVLSISIMCKDLWKLLHDINTSVLTEWKYEL
jgi:hypothetical protein